MFAESTKRWEKSFGFPEEGAMPMCRHFVAVTVEVKTRLSFAALLCDL